MLTRVEGFEINVAMDSTHRNALAREKAERLARLADAYRAGTLTDWEYLAAVQRVLDL